MPTIYDRYTIQWDGNSLSCDNAVILGYNGKNTTILTFENTSPYEDVRFIDVEFYGKGHTIVRGFENNAIETSLSPERYGHDAIMSLYWERDNGDHGVSRMGVIIERSEYFHDEETEAQADDNTQEIAQLKARVSSLESLINAMRGSPTVWSDGYQYDVGVSGQTVSLSKGDQPDLFADFGLDRGIGFSRIFAEGLPAAVETRYELRIRLYVSESPTAPVTSYKYSWKNSEAYAPNGIRFVLNRTSGEFIARWVENAESPVNNYEWVPEGDSSPSADTFNPNPYFLASVDTIEISANFDLADSKFTFSSNALRGGN